MSFGWSVGDLVTAIQFLLEVATALKESGGAADTYKEDSAYLDSIAITLDKARKDYEHGMLLPTLRNHVDTIWKPLQDMQEKIEMYHATLGQNDKKSIISRIRRQGHKAVYGIHVSKEVKVLRERISTSLQPLQLDASLSNLALTDSLRSDIGSLPDNILGRVEPMIRNQTDDLLHELKKRQQQDSLESVRSWLKPVSAETDYNNCLERILEGSCEWLFRRTEYREWYETIDSPQGDGSLLWVSGIPGAGKTTLATRVIQKLRDDHAIAYFYCDSKEEKQDVARILGTLCWQLLLESPHHLASIEDIYTGLTDAHKGNMKSCLTVLLNAGPKRIIVLDGIDECLPNIRRELCQIIASLSTKASIILFSREINDIFVALQTVCATESFRRLLIGEDDTKDDITKFIETKIKLLELEEDETEEVISALEKGADGMFQWADQMIENLQEGSCLGLDEYMLAIKQLPQGLDELYGRILSSLYKKELNRSRSAHLFQWLVCARRPLTLEEVAASLKASDKDMQRRPKASIATPKMRSVISNCCGSLVRIVQKNRDTVVVDLAHASVRDFLEKNKGSGQPFETLLVNAEAAERLIAKTCLDYLCYEDLEFPPFCLFPGKGREAWGALEEKFEEYLRVTPLLEYASLYWASHLSSLANRLVTDEELWKRFERFYLSEANTIRWLQIYLRLRGDRGLFRTSSALHDIEKFSYFPAPSTRYVETYNRWLSHLRDPPSHRFTRWNRFMSSGDANDFLPELHVAAFFDFSDFIEGRLQSGADPNQLSVDGQGPIHQAARGESVASGSILVSHGADVDAPGWGENTPLIWAIDGECHTTCDASGPFLMVPSLLSAGADPDHFAGLTSPLMGACDMPLPDDPYVLDVVRELLSRGLTKTINGHPENEPPLCLAIRKGAPSLVDLLLEAGADPNARDRDGRTPLHSCARQIRCEALLTKLLSLGADPNSRGVDGTTALHIAVQEGNVTGMRILIQAGASLEAEDRTGQMPLTLAVENGDTQAVKLLLDAGAPMEGTTWRTTWRVRALDWGHYEVVKMREAGVYWPRNETDLFHVYWMLRHRGSRENEERTLPRDVVFEIMDLARYWLKSSVSKTETTRVDEAISGLCQPYLVTQNVCGSQKSPVREIMFVTRSHDQGWSNYRQLHGTYEGSYTWFEVAIQKPDGSSPDFNGEGCDVIRNIHASSRPRQHCVIFGRRSPARLSKWIDLVERGDRIALMPKAAFPGWANFVQSAYIEVLTTCIKNPRLRSWVDASKGHE